MFPGTYTACSVSTDFSVFIKLDLHSHKATTVCNTHFEIESKVKCFKQQQQK